MAQRPKEDGVPTPEQPKQEGQSGNTSYPTYLKAALRIDSARAIGAANIEYDVLENENTTFTVPGICVIDWIPTLGVSTGVNSALNRATQREFRTTRAGISGSRKWEPVDQMIYRVCAESLHDLYTYAKRIYRICNGYSALNYYRPKAVLRAMGLNADSWINHASQLYQFLHTQSSAMESFPVVKYGSITDRHTAYNTTIYMDGEITRSQMYIMNQAAFWSYERVDQVKGLTLRKFEDGTYEEFLQLWDTLYTAMQQSFDVPQIVSDIERVYPAEKLIKKLDPPTEFEQVPIGKFDSVLSTIRNATIIPMDLENDVVRNNLRIRDDQGVLKCLDTDFPVAVRADLGTAYWRGTAFYSHINIQEDIASEDVIMHCTRLKPAFTVTQGAANTGFQTIKIDACGTEIAVAMRIITAPDEAAQPMELGSYIAYNPAAPTTVAMVAQALALISNFDWHPPIGIGMTGTDGATVGMYSVVEDMQNYVPMRRDQLKDIHENNMLYEFGIEA